MSELCRECYKRLLDPNAKYDDLTLSREDDLVFCEGCGEFKQNVIAVRKQSAFMIKLLMRRIEQKKIEGQ